MAIRKRPVSPRQKMINLMYVILMAMLALNVDGDVLTGFDRIDGSLTRTVAAARKESMLMYDSLAALMGINPVKTEPWNEKAEEVRRASERMMRMTVSLKDMIAREADGKDSDPMDLRNKEDMEAVAQVMLSPVDGKGRELREAIEAYRDLAVSVTADPEKRRLIADNLSTDVPQGASGKDWEHYMFESMPAVAAVTFLTKLQADITQAEREALHTLLASIDEGDMRMNAFRAVVVPSSLTVVRGGEFKAGVMMAAEDTTSVWDMYIDGRKVDYNDGQYSLRAGQTGEHTLSGYLQMTGRNGGTVRREFTQRYTVIDPIATVSADMTNVLYAGYDNPVSVSVPGHSPGEVKAVMEGGVLTQLAPGKYTARPSGEGEASISVSVTKDGKVTDMGRYAFRVRQLPDPMPYIPVTDGEGRTRRYRSGAIPKASLTEATELRAAIDDGILDTPFRVTSFEAVFFDSRGDAVPVASDGPRFSERQKDTFRQLARGKRLYITRVTVTGPDGASRTLDSSMELIVR